LEPDRMNRLERALALFRQGRVDKILIVGGFRPSRPVPGGRELANLAARILDRPNAVAADATSFDTLSNISSVCPLQQQMAPGRALVLISDPLHLARIWADRRQLSCVSRGEIGFAASNPNTNWIWQWYSVNKDWGARALRWIAGDEAYRAMVRVWRAQQG
jgi:hypothetical protein